LLRVVRAFLERIAHRGGADPEKKGVCLPTIPQVGAGMIRDRLPPTRTDGAHAPRRRDPTSRRERDCHRVLHEDGAEGLGEPATGELAVDGEGEGDDARQEQHTHGQADRPAIGGHRQQPRRGGRARPECQRQHRRRAVVPDGRRIEEEGQREHHAEKRPPFVRHEEQRKGEHQRHAKPDVLPDRAEEREHRGQEPDGEDRKEGHGRTPYRVMHQKANSRPEEQVVQHQHAERPGRNVIRESPYPAHDRRKPRIVLAAPSLEKLQDRIRRQVARPEGDQCEPEPERCCGRDGDEFPPRERARHGGGFRTHRSPAASSVARSLIALRSQQASDRHGQI